MQPVIEKPALPAEIHSLVMQLQAVFQQYGYAINQIIAEPAFIAPTLLNSWVNYGGGYSSAGYYKDATGRVHLQGALKDGTVSSAAFTLPEGFRPSSVIIVLVYTEEAGTKYASYLSINSSGDVTPGPALGGTSTNDFVSLEGISFAAV